MGKTFLIFFSLNVLMLELLRIIVVLTLNIFNFQDIKFQEEIKAPKVFETR